jgi:hypothetical protein
MEGQTMQRLLAVILLSTAAVGCGTTKSSVQIETHAYKPATMEVSDAAGDLTARVCIESQWK